MDKISDKLDTISKRLYTVENKMSYIEKQLYLWKLHEQTSNKPRRQQIPQYVAPISRRTHQPPIMKPYFKPPRYKKHVNEAPTQHTNHNARTHQPPSTRPSSQLDAPTQPPVHPVQPTTLTTPAQSSTHQAQRAQPDQTTEPYQTTLPTSTKTETQRTPMPKRYSHSAQKSQLYSMSPATRSKRTRHSSTDNEHYIISPVFEPRLKNRKVLTSPVKDIDPYADAVPHLDNDFSDWT